MAKEKYIAAERWRAKSMAEKKNNIKAVSSSRMAAASGVRHGSGNNENICSYQWQALTCNRQWP
jgi:hypothetical protein